MNRRKFSEKTIHAALGLAASTLLPTAARAASASGPAYRYPEHVIRVIVPYPAGGIADVVIRAVTSKMALMGSQAIVVENRPGADGRIGAEAVARAQPDGYTLLEATPALAVNETLYPAFKTRARDFRAIGAVGSTSSVFVVNKDVPVKTLKEFVAWARGRPDKVNVPNPGSGTTMYLGQELFFQKTGLHLTTVGYKGQPPGALDLSRGLLQFALLSESIALPMIHAGKLRPLAVSSDKRTRSLPDVPTVVEAGFPDVVVQSWYGLVAPKSIPVAALKYLKTVFAQAINSPEVGKQLESLGCQRWAIDASQFDRFIEQERERWASLMKSRNIAASS
ncbi:Bug family tripartite tricarboxylate transporter substrate binding protein [Candidimonas nitroreducens]|uniref:ABC transporter substrate-binding protein n=1 Tax=Candidimonas nitroreducens TaxID=683354 RepID=A0A225N397_9BURK|nr:tripartite tricarboxylate transporter substrate binding protein [Candidimonas nitroreducens]OWT66341.1 hypothetical protein CEY11_00985 [Candidimonas nitroreducens]